MSRLLVATLLCSSLVACEGDDNPGGSGRHGRGFACSVTAPCDDGEGLACIEGVCLETCGANYYSASACRDDEVCSPVGRETGYCKRSECTVAENNCGIDRECLQIKDEAGTCITPCTATFVDGNYEDDCAGEAFCQALGREGQRRLACLPSEPAGQPIGTFCNVIDQPCATNQSYIDSGGDIRTFGLTCAGSQCVELCDASLPSPANNQDDCGASVGRGATYCCGQEGAAGDTWGVCIPFSGTGACDPQLY